MSWYDNALALTKSLSKSFPARIRFNESGDAYGIRPELGNKFYNTIDAGGISSAIVPKYYVEGLNVLPNCVGYAYGRFNEIVGYYSGKNMTSADMLLIPANASNIYTVSVNHRGCVISGRDGIPQVGAIIVWSYPNKPGHVAIVEKVISNDEIYTSESAYTSNPDSVESKTFYIVHRYRSSDGNWNASSGYTFLGFIYNPSVPDNPPDGVYTGGAVSYTEAQTYSIASSYSFPPLNYSSDTIFTTETVSSIINRDGISKVDREYNTVDSQSVNLLSYPSLVEAPFINVKIGDYTFGKYQEYTEADVTHKIYPNFINSINIIKTNGTVNVYTINMLYLIRAGDDPNFIDKILSSVGYGIIKISYGDYASPSFIYKEEEALITKVTSKVDFSNNNILYVIYCTSSAISALGTNYSFPAHYRTKPSDVIYRLLLQSSYYGLDKVFTGITGKNLSSNFSKFIATDDLAVDIPAKSYIDPISYINYLVSYMVPQEDSSASVSKSATYYMTIHDDSYADYSTTGGTYFKVTKVSSTYSLLPTFNTYTVDVGYPGGNNPGENLVMNFTITDDNSWSLLYDYSEHNLMASLEDYSYTINNQGQTVQNYSPNITLNAIHGKTTAAMKSWWTRMTEFPISATLVIKGLIRPAMLMTYLRVNTYFYGKKHVSSGLYIITKQEDKIDGAGYRTTLYLTRIAGVDEYIERKSYTATSEIITGIRLLTHTQFLSGPDTHIETSIIGEEVVLPETGTSLYWLPVGTIMHVLTYEEKDENNNVIITIYNDATKKPIVDMWEEVDTRDNRGYLMHSTASAYILYDTDFGIVQITEEMGPQIATHYNRSTRLGIEGEFLVWLKPGTNEVYFHPAGRDLYDEINPGVDYYVENQEGHPFVPYYPNAGYSSGSASR